MRMPIRRLILILAAASLMAPASAIAAPPQHGAALPANEDPAQISRSYVGPAYVGPRGFCKPIANTPDGTEGTMCTSIVMRRCRIWTRPMLRTGTWRRGPAVSNAGTDMFWVAPYSRGYHWVISLKHSGVMASKCLYAMQPSWGITR